jgi:hypothetical protein
MKTLIYEFGTLPDLSPAEQIAASRAGEEIAGLY